MKNKVDGLPFFAQWACKDPCGEQKGKALSGATIGSVVANPSLSARLRSKKVSINRYLLFFIPCRKLACRQRYEKQSGRLAVFAQWACWGPCGKQKGKASSGATTGSVVANPSLSALKNLQEIESQSCRFFMWCIVKCAGSYF